MQRSASNLSLALKSRLAPGPLCQAARQRRPLGPWTKRLVMSSRLTRSLRMRRMTIGSASISQTVNSRSTSGGCIGGRIGAAKPMLMKNPQEKPDDVGYYGLWARRRQFKAFCQTHEDYSAPMARCASVRWMRQSGRPTRLAPCCESADCTGLGTCPKHYGEGNDDDQGRAHRSVRSGGIANSRRIGASWP